MNPSEDTTGFRARKAELDALLAQTREAIGANDEQRLISIAERLEAIVAERAPESGVVRTLKRIAADTAAMLRKEGIEGKLDSLGARIAELANVEHDSEAAPDR